MQPKWSSSMLKVVLNSPLRTGRGACKSEMRDEVGLVWASDQDVSQMHPYEGIIG